jgi:hypothetical protein
MLSTANGFLEVRPGVSCQWTASSTGQGKQLRVQSARSGELPGAGLVAGMRDDAGLNNGRPRYRIDHRGRQEFSEAAITPIIHVKEVCGQERLERHAIQVMPFPHDGKARK